MLLLTGCASGGAADPCAPWAPIWVSPGDVLTPATAEQILAHNETGARICGWQGTTD